MSKILPAIPDQSTLEIFIPVILTAYDGMFDSHPAGF